MEAYYGTAGFRETSATNRKKNRRHPNLSDGGGTVLAATVMASCRG